MKRKTKKMSLTFLIVVGGSFILWADAICDLVKWDIAPRTFQVLGLTTVIIAYTCIQNEDKVKRILKGQLGW